MVLAAFLNKHLLEPRERRLRAEGFNEGLAQNQAQARAEGFSEGLAQSQDQSHAEGFDEGRAAALAEVRLLLQEQGFNLDEIALPGAGGDMESANAERC